MAERQKLTTSINSGSAQEVADQASATGQTVSKTAREILERATSATTAHEQCQARLAELAGQAKAAAARVKAAKREWAQDTNEATTAALDASKRELELLGERQAILGESLAEIRAELDAATAEANAVQIDQLSAEAEQLWARMSLTVEQAAAAVVATRSEYRAFEQLRAELATNAKQREALGALRDVNNEHKWEPMAWFRACKRAFSAANSGEFPMSELDAQQVAYLIYNSTPYSRR
jgi:hypothetical protein